LNHTRDEETPSLNHTRNENLLWITQRMIGFS